MTTKNYIMIAALAASLLLSGCCPDTHTFGARLTVEPQKNSNGLYCVVLYPETENTMYQDSSNLRCRLSLNDAVVFRNETAKRMNIK